jgi:hypothetical protein
MVEKGIYNLLYTIDKETFGLNVIVELRQVEGIPKKGQNVWEGVVTVNYDGKYAGEDLSHCVNALIACERIGHKLRDELKTKAKAEGKSFRIKKETIK